MVVEYNRVRSRQVDSKSSCSRTKKENKNIGPDTSESPDQITVLDLTSSANPLPYPYGLRALRNHPDVNICIVGISNTPP